MEGLLENINKAGLHFLEPLTLTQTFQTIIVEAAGMLDAQWGALYLAEGDQLERKAVYPDRSSILLHPRRRGYTYRAYAERKPFIIRGKGVTNIHPELKEHRYKIAVCIPLSDHAKSIGAILILKKEDIELSTKELHMLKVFGSYASLAIRKAHFYEEMQKALEIRDLFIAMAAHELRTPLTTINGYIQLLHSKTPKDNSLQAKWVHQLLIESKRLTVLINELLEVNRIKAGQFNYMFREYDIFALAKQAVERFVFNHPSRVVTFKHDNIHSCSVICDNDKLIQVINNILENAAKFSPPESEIHIAIRSSTRFIYLSIIDKGIGIKKSELHKVFDEFYKKAKESDKGLGLGLFIAKNIVKVHKGTIVIRTEEGKGTAVEIKLPKIQATKVEEIKNVIADLAVPLQA